MWKYEVAATLQISPERGGVLANVSTILLSWGRFRQIAIIIQF